MQHFEWLKEVPRFTGTLIPGMSVNPAMHDVIAAPSHMCSHSSGYSCTNVSLASLTGPMLDRDSTSLTQGAGDPLGNNIGSGGDSSGENMQTNEPHPDSDDEGIQDDGEERLLDGMDALITIGY
jgi:hypothetical protein